jgi:uncharacterized protein DUF4157/putative RNase toxin 15 of polymorphic toxin system
MLAAEKTITRVASAPAPVAPVQIAAPVRPQTAGLKVSSPSDPAEKEAETTAKKVMRMAAPERAGARSFVSPYVARFAHLSIGRATRTVARKGEGQPDVAANINAEIAASQASGQPLPHNVRRFMEPRFQADFSRVRIHTGETAARLNTQLSARAFTVGPQVFFGRDRFKPETSEGRELIAHELTHTIQQGAAPQGIQRSEDVSVTEQSPVHVQRSILSDGLDFVAERANNIPGFRMFTIVLGINPINMSAVDRSPANVLRAVIEFVPGGGLITQALDSYGIIDKAGNWVAQQIKTLGMVGGAIRDALVTFINSLGFGDFLSPTATWNRAKRIFTEPIDRVIAFAKGLVNGFLELIKAAVLRPLAGLAQGLAGYDLLKAVLEKDPVTGDPYPRTPETVIGGFMKLAGQSDVWAKMQETKAVPRAWKWFTTALNELVGFVREIPPLFFATLKSLEIADLILPPLAFIKVGKAFGNFVGRFITWAGSTVWNLLEIIFDVVSPGALGYIKKTGNALKSILKNPLPFVGNLVKAAKGGFTNFAGNFLEHLKAGLIDWLTGSLPGIYIPKALNLAEIAKFVLSVLGLTWANIRQKLVKVVGETAVKAMEAGFDIVVALVTQGPAAAWDKIKEQLTNLKDMVISGITDLVIDAVVKKAIPKLIAMFIPGAGFISAIISIYDTVMVFVQKISKIIQVVTAFINSIVAIASGNISAAAAKVESILAGLLSLAISFLAGFAGLGNVASKIMGVIQKIRAPIDKAIDWLINWIVTMAKKLGKFVAQAGLPQDPTERLRLGMPAAVSAVNRFAGKRVGAIALNPLLAAVKVRYGFKTLEVFPQGNAWAVRGQINPETIAFTRVIVGKDEDTGAETTKTIVDPPLTLVFEFRRFTARQNVSINEMTEGLQHHQSALNALTVEQWLANIYFRAWLKGAVAAEERDIGRKDLIAQLRAEIVKEYADKGRTLTKSQLDTLIKLRSRGRHASHDADAISGGNIDDFDSLERGAVNSYIGSNWGRFRPELEAYAMRIRQNFEPKDWSKVHMNFRLRQKFLN